jgi:hypothetical protein
MMASSSVSSPVARSHPTQRAWKPSTEKRRPPNATFDNPTRRVSTRNSDGGMISEAPMP